MRKIWMIEFIHQPYKSFAPLFCLSQILGRANTRLSNMGQNGHKETKWTKSLTPSSCLYLESSYFRDKGIFLGFLQWSLWLHCHSLRGSVQCTKLLDKHLAKEMEIELNEEFPNSVFDRTIQLKPNPPFRSVS